MTKHTPDTAAPRREDAAGERTSFALAAELLDTAVWIAERTASPDNQRHLEVLQRAIGFLRGDSRGELIDVRYLIRNDAGCAAIAAHIRNEEIARHEAALSTAEREREAARLDTERLDWLFQNSWDSTVLIEMPERPGECQSIKLSRKAIDRARVPSGGET